MYKLLALRSSSSFYRKQLQSIFMSAKRCLATSAGYVTVDNDVELYYEQYGDTSKDAILCIPGAIGSVRGDFSYQLDNLSDNFNVLAYDPRGYGKSQKTKRQYPLNYFHQDADDASQLMQKLGFGKYSVLGWSDGGIVGLILAAQNKSVHSLVIWGASAFVTDDDCKLIEMTRDVRNWSERMRKPMELIYGKEGFQNIWNDFVDGFCAFVKQPDGSICIPELKDISCPTLIVHGAKDPLVPSFHPEYLHNQITNSKLIVMPDGKHNLHMRYYEEFNDLVKKFLKE